MALSEVYGTEIPEQPSPVLAWKPAQKATAALRKGYAALNSVLALLHPHDPELVTRTIDRLQRQEEWNEAISVRLNELAERQAWLEGRLERQKQMQHRLRIFQRVALPALLAGCAWPFAAHLAGLRAGAPAAWLAPVACASVGVVAWVVSVYRGVRS